MLRSSPSQMCRWLSTNPGMTIMPVASITSALVDVEPGTHLDDAVPLDQHVAHREVADRGIDAEHRAAADQRLRPVGATAKSGAPG